MNVDEPKESGPGHAEEAAVAVEGAGAAKDEGGGRLQVSVFDEDAGGPPTIILAGPGEKVGKLIDEFYSLIEATPKPGDRLQCLATGEAVDPHRGEHIREYAAGYCGDLVWTFAADTGGAGR